MSGILGGIAKIAGGLIGAGKKKKASTEAQAVYDAQQNKAIEQSKATQDAQEALYRPYVDAGNVGLDRLSSGIAEGGRYVRPFSAADFQADPGYEFRKEEGLRALDRTLSARGSAFSGAQIRGAQDYGQNIASEEYNNAYNRYNNDVNTDYTRTANLANMGFNGASGVSGTLGAEGTDIRGSLIDIGANDATGIRERGAISAQALQDAIKEGISTVDNIASTVAGGMSGMPMGSMGGNSGAMSSGGDANSLIMSLKSLLGDTSRSNSVQYAPSSSGTSMSNLARIFSRGG